MASTTPKPTPTTPPVDPVRNPSSEPRAANTEIANQQAAPEHSPKMKANRAKFQVSQRVHHAANAKGLFPEGTGLVTSVTPWNTGDGFSYKVKCDKTGKELPVNFKESELSPFTEADREASSKFKAGDRVNHPEDTEGRFALGTGTVEEVKKPLPPSERHTYTIKSDETGRVLPYEFKEGDLSGRA